MALKIVLTLFPVALVAMLCFKMKFAGKKQIHEDCWNREDSKNLQVVAAVGIILHHMVQLLTEYSNSGYGPISVMNSMGVLFTGLFFFYSGFGLTRSLTSKEGYLKGFLRKRLVTVLAPFLVTNIVYSIWAVSNNWIQNYVDFFKSLFGIILVNDMSWFIIEISLLYILFFFTFRFIKKKGIALIVMYVLTLGIIYGSMLLGHGEKWFMGEWWFNATLIFPVGLTIGLYRDKLVNFFRNKVTVLIPLSFAAFVGAFIFCMRITTTMGYYDGGPYYTPTVWNMTLTMLSQNLAEVTFIFMFLMLTMKVRFSNIILKKLGAISIEIYLMQRIFIAIIYEKATLPVAVTMLLTILATIAAAAIVHFPIKKLSELFIAYGKKEYKGFGKKLPLIVIHTVEAIYTVIICILIFNLVSPFFKNCSCGGKSVEQEIALISTAKPGDLVTYGKWEQDYGRLGDEEITWYVLDKDEEKAMLISEYVLEGFFFSREYKETSYKESDLRDYVLGTVYEESFSDKEKERIVADKETGDSMFVLSLEQARKYLADKKLLAAKTTEKSKKTQTNVIVHSENSWYWLRHDDKRLFADVVNGDGEIKLKEEEVSRSQGGVRPAIYVKFA